MNQWHFDQFIEPVLEAKKKLIVESYYFKFMVKERIFNHADSILYELLSRLPSPRFVILIDTDPSLACERKLEISSYETLGERKCDFIHFQGLVRKGLLDAIAPFPHVIVNGNNPFESVYLDFVQAIQKATDVNLDFPEKTVLPQKACKLEIKNTLA